MVTCHGTHEGPFLGLDPTRKKIHVRCTVFQHFQNDKVTQAEVSWDVLGMLNQVGLRPAVELYENIREAAKRQAEITA